MRFTRIDSLSWSTTLSMLYQLATILGIGPSTFYEGLDTNPPGSLNKADPDVVRAEVAHIVAGLDATTLEIVRDVLVSLKKPDLSPDPVLPSRELALTASSKVVPQVKKRRRARFRSKEGE